MDAGNRVTHLGRGRVALSALAAAVIALSVTPANAQSNTAAQYFTAKTQNSSVPDVLDDAESAYYSALFKAIDGENWEEVDALLEERQFGPLHGVAIAEYYTHANSPAVTAEQIGQWFNIGRRLPQAEQLGRLGERRGLDDIPTLPHARSFQRQPGASKRIRPRSVDDGTMPEEIESAILAHIRDDDPDGARLLLDGIDANLSSATRAEWRQKVAWSYYIENDDPAAQAMARTVAAGTGAWVAEGAWVEGLAAWRLNDCTGAAEAFSRAARQSTSNELTAAAHFWASRANIRCRKPADAERHLSSATQFDETLYGMLAIEQRGQTLPGQYASADLTERDWRGLSDIANVRELRWRWLRLTATAWPMKCCVIRRALAHPAIFAAFRGSPASLACLAHKSGWRTMPRAAHDLNLLSNTPSPIGNRAMAGGSTLHSPLPTLCKNRVSAPLPSAQPMRAG